MNKINVLLLFGALISFGVRAQDAPVYAEGKVFSKATKEAVVAKISYQSEPYGNVVGELKGSAFSIPLFDNEKYSIVVEAPGFAPSKYLLDPAAANGERKVIQDIELAVPAAAATTAETAHTVGHVMRLDALIFQQRSAIISPESYPELNTVAKMLHNNPKMVIQLEGHTDTRGDAKLNLKLSEDRVIAVRDYLISRGVPKARVKTKAFGGSMPLSRENTEEAHKLNRRVEARILEN
ncbi:MAG TPA: OmpA family protein [Cyclobacteriaceae bacterium]|nr:OmpA family protein [Cyclobacteriaceae bacterium]